MNADDRRFWEGVKNALFFAVCFALACVVFAFAQPAQAATERPWSTSAACAGQAVTCGESQAAWRAPPGLVLTATSMTADYFAGRWADWASLAADAPVYACAQDRPADNAANCDPNERYIPKSQVFGFAAPAAQPSVTLVGGSVTRGASITLTWDAKDVSSCASSWSGVVPPQGSLTLTPTASAKHQLDCTGLDGLGYSARTSVNVIDPLVPLPKQWPTTLKARLEAAPGGKYVLFWATAEPRGISHYALYFDWARAAEWAAKGVLTKADYDTAYDRVKTPMTEEERTYAYGPYDADADGDDDSLASRFGVRAVVTVNGTALSRPVHAANADGTRNTTPVASARVAVGARCQPSDRLIASTGAATNYYSVEGQDNVATPATDTLGRLFAICTLTAPSGLN